MAECAGVECTNWVRQSNYYCDDCHANPPARKRCVKCKKIKPRSQFNANSKNWDGLHAYCTDCNAVATRLTLRRLSVDPEWAKRSRDQHSARRQAVRREAIARYGGKCACCGEDRYEFLALDHENGGGNKHRIADQSARHLAAWLKRRDWPDGVRVLCHNCNMAIGFYGTCPHDEEKVIAA